MSNIDSIMTVMPVHEDNVFLSFLPLSNALERTVIACNTPGDNDHPKGGSDLRSVAATQWALERMRQALWPFPSHAIPRAVSVSIEP